MTANDGNTPRRRGPKPRQLVDLTSTLAHDYGDYVFTKRWSYSTGQRRAKVVGAYTVDGIPGKQVIPARAEAILRNEAVERGRLRRGPGLPQRGVL